ncbi:hypothetical protein F4779DRAFT_635468 [Xylariaceae sp. FL0662B]|nr:hypothetical protein F4779DRAFT_635468 [Xylariaceae sp. FL0662B]
MVVLANVEVALVDVRRATEETLHKNVDVIKQINIEQSKEISELQDSHDSERISQIQTLLGFETYLDESQAEVLEKYRRNLSTDSDLNERRLERMQGPRLDEFLNHSDFYAWKNSSRSCMLLLVGYNNGSIWNANQCWASPVALHMISSFEGLEDSISSAFYISAIESSESLQQVIFTILLQLLDKNRQSLQNETGYSRLKATIQEYRQADDGSDRALVLLQNVALRVLDLFDESKPVYIILDRADRRREDRKRFLKLMTYLIEKTKVRLRVLAVVGGFDWPVDEQADELGNPGSVRVHIARQELIEEY